jgi:hypothetical protein
MLRRCIVWGTYFSADHFQPLPWRRIRAGIGSRPPFCAHDGASSLFVARLDVGAHSQPAAPWSARYQALVGPLCARATAHRDAIAGQPSPSAIAMCWPPLCSHHHRSRSLQDTHHFGKECLLHLAKIGFRFLQQGSRLAISPCKSDETPTSNYAACLGRPFERTRASRYLVEIMKYTRR